MPLTKLEELIGITTAGSEVLAAQVVAYKSLGINKKLALICMNELARRRGLGEEFNFEQYIDDEVKKVPTVPKVDLVKISQAISRMKIK